MWQGKKLGREQQIDSFLFIYLFLWFLYGQESKDRQDIGVVEEME